MTNYEAFMDELIDKVSDGKFSLAVEDGLLTECSMITCARCDLYAQAKKMDCQMARKEWLLAEAKLTMSVQEHKLCKMLAKGWIARDADDRLFFYEEKPTKGFHGSWIANGDTDTSNLTVLFNKEILKFIRFSDAEPWYVDTLLALHVREDLHDE